MFQIWCIYVQICFTDYAFYIRHSRCTITNLMHATSNKYWLFRVSDSRSHRLHYFLTTSFSGIIGKILNEIQNFYLKILNLNFTNFKRSGNAGCIISLLHHFWGIIRKILIEILQCLNLKVRISYIVVLMDN